MTKTFRLLCVEFELAELRDICDHGMAGGVGGFIYTTDLESKFDEWSDEILMTCDQWADDVDGSCAMQWIIKDDNDYHYDQIKSDLVWMYMEIKANEYVQLEEDNWIMITSKYLELSVLCIIGCIVIGGFLTYPGMTLVCVFASALLIGKSKK